MQERALLLVVAIVRCLLVAVLYHLCQSQPHHVISLIGMDADLLLYHRRSHRCRSHHHRGKPSSQRFPNEMSVKITSPGLCERCRMIFDASMTMSPHKEDRRLAIGEGWRIMDLVASGFDKEKSGWRSELVMRGEAGSWSQAVQPTVFRIAPLNVSSLTQLSFRSEATRCPCNLCDV